MGYTAQTLIGKLSSNSWQYSGTNRSGDNLIFDGRSPLEEARKHLHDVTHLLISIAPNQDFQDPVLYHHKQDIHDMPNLKWIGYLSATSVYGDKNGEWVDEASSCNPTSKRGERRLEAEKDWLSTGLPVHIFRLGGIYGSKRNQIEAIKNGTANKVVRKNLSFSRIHVDDICAALIASMQNPSQNKIYNVVDNEPTASATVMDFLCDNLELPRIDAISHDDPSLSEMAKSFYRDNKRVKNDLIKKELGWSPQFPTYREGYLDILAKLDKG